MLPKLEQHSAMDQDPAASDTIRRVVADVLERMFFTEAELAPCEHGWLGSARCAEIRFEGSHWGEMLLGVSAEAVDPIAAAFLGLDPVELTDAQRGQMVQEMSNILCGAILSQLWPESRLAISSPELAAWREWPGKGMLHRCFVIPEGLLAISIGLLASRPGGG